jgi:hypothetical protein
VIAFASANTARARSRIAGASSIRVAAAPIVTAPGTVMSGNTSPTIGLF